MLKSELNELQGVVNALLQHSSAQDTMFRDDLLQEINRISDELIQRWTGNYFGISKDHVISRYIRYHQAGITRLSNRLFASGHSGPSVASSALEALLTYLRTYFYREYDHSVSVTDFCIDDWSMGLHEKRISVQDGWHPGSDERKLADAVFGWLEHISSGPFKRRLSYATMETVKEFTGSLMRLSGRAAKAREIFELLVEYKVDIAEASGWYKAYISNELHSLSKSGKKSFIDQEIAKFESLQPKVDVAQSGKTAMPGQLLAWLQELKGDRQPAPIVSAGDYQKVALNLSVAQFGLFLRLCYLEGCFHEDNISAMLRFFSSRFTSKRQDHISFKSLGRAFYHSEQKHAAYVRGWLQQMIMLIDQRYFPQ